MHKNKLGIKDWAQEDRPREKLLLKGRRILSDAELLAIILGSGNKNENAVELSKRILSAAGNSIDDLAQWSVDDFKQFQGIGEAKAINIIAALELGRRRKNTSAPNRKKITSSQMAFEAARSCFMDLPYEEFWVLHLNRANEIIFQEKISQGGISGTIADVRIILKSAVAKLSSGLILCHNHPSGNLQPSTQDISLTKKIKEAAKLLDITVLDHLIIFNHQFYSFADNGLM